MAFLTSQDRKKVADKMNALKMNAACPCCSAPCAIDENLWGFPINTDKQGTQSVNEMLASVCTKCGHTRFFFRSALLP
jgi:hypothetical protein